MAKSQGFFTLRRGSTKSLTFQVLDGKQITKDRVSVVRNPKTSGQAAQRAKMLPAQRFMAMFRSIVDHSWENVAYGQKSLQHFLSKAMTIQPTNPMVKGQIGWYPQAYPISEGSLPTMEATRTGGETMLVQGLKGIGGQNVSFENFMTTNPLLQEGDQLTAIAVIEAGANYAVVIDRVVLNENTFDVELAGFETENKLFTLQGDDAGPIAVALSNDSIIYAGAVVLSRRTASKWLRSSETLFCDFLGYDDWATAVQSYMASASELKSPWYLNAADNDTISESDLNSGNWVPYLLGQSTNPGSDSKVYLGARNKLYGNYAIVTKNGDANGKAYEAALSSSQTLAQVTLSSFGESAKTGYELGQSPIFGGAIGSTALVALSEDQVDEFIAKSAL